MSRTPPYRSLRRQSRPWRGDRLGLGWIGLIVRSRIELRRRDGGFSLIVIFLLVLSVLTTTLALTSRTTGGLYAQSYQGKLRLAKDAAENGLTIVASEFNYPGNRLVLGGASVNKINSLGGLDPNILLWDSKVIPADINARPNPDQPCYIYSLSAGFSANNGGGAIRQDLSPGSAVDVKDKNIIYKPSVVQNPVSRRYDGVNNTSWFDSISRNPNNFHYLGNGQFYRIIALRLYNSDHTENSSDALKPYATAAKGQVSYLTVAVEGVYNYQLVSRRSPTIFRGRIEAQGTGFVNYANSVRYTMQQEFQVVPRCCSQGFGKVNGIDYGPITATADSSNCTATTPKPNTQTEWILRSVSRTSAFNRLP